MDSADNQGTPKEWNLDLSQVDGERAVGASDLREVSECERRSRETSSRNRKRETVCQHLRANSILAYLIIYHGIYRHDIRLKLIFTSQRRDSE